ncbi:DUF5060 domain-containing protein [Luteolibacter arcticus]|uniref:DUF5060 domain-containing protein n=1 Tax=Luteolibacter arcticus TaxID=1581411 RepID=A0ABT3GJL6_9BACT|nr:DUF5060 domain-containing protein [Luteolibacter arcticus]MCW1923698.1 DUF5060 domain-containing protein [Luteolibacter arcticus]
MSFSPLHRRFVPWAIALFLGAGCVVAHAQQGIALPIEGELKRWHKLTFDFVGPDTGETATPNPFTDYRLDLTFTHAVTGTTMVVPGFYAADGNAAESSSSAGNIWRAHFAPTEVGDWTYTVSFRSGAGVATADSPLSGASGGYFDGLQGGFTVAPTDKAGRDFRAKGRLEYVGRHHLRFAGTGEYFMKAGTDSPENLLSYADFDGDFKTDLQKDELVKTWAPHVADWQPGDPVWQGTKGKGLIGALNYLASEGLNSVSFLTMNINGDDKNVFPYTTYAERLRLDVSRLDQWEKAFEHATHKGLYLHFKTQETENEMLLDNGNLGPQRKLYYRELIARFSHHLALNWNLGEEINNASTAQKVAWAQFFQQQDPYKNHIVIHNGDQHFDLMGPQFPLTGMSLQLNEPNFSDTFVNVLRYVRRSDQYGKAWVVGCDEPGNASDSLRPDSNPGNSQTDARRDALWATILAGGAGCEFYFGSKWAHSDMTCQDFRSRDLFWDYCRHALAFFKENDFSFELMSNQNELVSGAGDNGNRCLAKTGDTYLVQLRAGGTHTLNLSAASGNFSVKWFNPRSGGSLPAADLQGGSVVSLGAPPADPDPIQDWIVLVKSTSGGSATNTPPTVTAGDDRQAFLTSNAVSLSLEGEISDDGLPDPLALDVGWIMMSGPEPVTFSQAQAAATQATFTAPGTYVLSLAADDGDLDAHEEITVTIELPELTGRRNFSPSQDAFTDAGENNNGETLAVRLDDRRTYLMFDLTALDADPMGAVLRLTEADGVAAEAVTLRAFSALSNDWNEAGISMATAPEKGAELAVFSGAVGAGETIEIDLGEMVTGPGIHGIILEAESGEASFVSKESADEAGWPKLVVTTHGNTVPVYDGYAFLATVNEPLTLPYAALLAGAYDPDGDPVTPVIANGSSSQGGQVVMDAEGLTYTPSIDYFGPDSFVLTVGDGRGGFATAEITVQVNEPPPAAPPAPPTVERVAEGVMRFRYLGTPGVNHTLQRSIDLVEWLTLATDLGLETGEIDYLDTEALESAAFYRITTP